MPHRTLIRRVLPVALGLATATGVAVGAAPPTPAWAEPGAPTGRVIVKFEGAAQSQPAARTRILRTASARSGTQLSESRALTGGAQLITVQGETAEQAAARLSRTDGVEYAEVDRFIPTSLAQPSSAYYGSEQWALGAGVGGINLAAARPWATGAGVRVAVVDTGKLRHPDLDAAWLGGWDFIDDADGAGDRSGRDADASDTGDWVRANECFSGSEAAPSSWHGAHVAGIIAARGSGIDGVAAGAQIVPVRVLGKCGGSLSDIMEGVAWAAGLPVSGVPTNPHPARIINLSIESEVPCSEFARSVFDEVRGTDALVVAAAGNAHLHADDYWPGACGDAVFPVAATSRGGSPTGFSNYGPTVAVSAPGVDVLSTVNFGETRPTEPAYNEYEGTSMAAPHVSGIAALVLQLQPSITRAQLDATLRRSVTPATNAYEDCCGAGIINAKLAVDTVIPTQVSAKWSGLRGTLGAYRSIRKLPGKTTWARFANGHITYDPTHGAHATWGRIGAEYARLGGPATVGVATTDEQKGRGGHLQNRFVNGWILYSAQGAHLIDGERLTYWTKLSSADVTTLGQLRSGTVTSGANRSARFTNGAIVDSSKGTFWMHSAIYRRHQALPSTTRSALGTLTAVEAAGLIPGQRVSRFTGGAIYYAGATGAWAVSSEIDQRYRATGVAAALGNPSALQQTVRFGARKASFAKGSIYAHSSTGAWEVHGAIGRAFTAAGAEKSRLELPTSGEIRSGSTTYQKFRGGRITYAGGKTTIRYS